MTNILVLLGLVLVGTRATKLLFSKKARKKSIICKCLRLISVKLNRRIDKALEHETALNHPKVVDFKPVNKRARG